MENPAATISPHHHPCCPCEFVVHIGFRDDQRLFTVRGGAIYKDILDDVQFGLFATFFGLAGPAYLFQEDF